MDCYANPPLSLVEFTQNQQLQNDLPNSPLGSPPNTPSRNLPIEHNTTETSVMNTSAVNTSFNTFGSSNYGSSTYDRFPESLLEQDDVPMDEKKHDEDPMILMEDFDGPDDEMMGRLDSPTKVSLKFRKSLQLQPPRVSQQDEGELRSLARKSSDNHSVSAAFNLGNSSVAAENQRAKTAGDLNVGKRSSVRDRIMRFEQSTPAEREEKSAGPALKTPDKDLLSPPKLLLKKTLWQSNASSARADKNIILSPLSSAKKNENARTLPMDERSQPYGQIAVLHLEKAESDVPEDERQAMMKAAAAALLDKRQTIGQLRETRATSKTFAENLNERQALTQRPDALPHSRNESTDAEVASMTQDGHPMTTPKNEVNPKIVSGLSNNETSPRRPVPRRLNYEGDTIGPDTPEKYQKNRRVKAEILISPDGEMDDGVINAQEEMQLSGSNTRAADSRFRSIDVNSPTNGPAIEIELNPSESRTITSGLSINDSRSPILESDLRQTELLDLQTQKHIFVQSFDSFVGIARGDITVSLLNEMSPTPSCASRVHAAIWRCRRMRASMGVFPSSASMEGRIMPPVDQDVGSSHDAAFHYLLADEVDQATELYQGILSAYQSYHEKNFSSDMKRDERNIQRSIGVAQHNLGILNLLKGDYNVAMSCFTEAIQTRKASFADGHPDHTASLVKKATCHYALNQFSDAQKQYEEALACAKRSCSTVDDRVQIAEILNNLGYLAYMSEQPEEAQNYFEHCMDVQVQALSDSLYESSQITSQLISLNVSIVRSNIGFVKMVTKALPSSITALENALIEQQVLLKGADETMIATMEHLAVANLLGGKQKRAANMFERILDLLEKEYGQEDKRYRMAIDRINMVRSIGNDFEEAVKELQKTVLAPLASSSSSKTKPPMNPSSKSGATKPPTWQLKSKQSIKNRVLGSAVTKKKKPL